MPTRRPTMLHEVNAALADAREGISPSFSPEVLAGRLGLNEPTPDGLQLWGRFVGSEQPTVGTLRGVVRLLRDTRTLFELTNAGEENAAQLALAKALGWVIARQVTREQNICPDAAGLAALAQRSDILPPAIRAAALDASEGQTAQNLIDGLLPQALINEALAESAHIPDNVPADPFGDSN